MPTKFADVSAGDMIIADGTHKCLRPGQVCKVYADDGLRQNMSINCSHREPHFLCADTEGNLAGFQKMRHQPDARS